MAKAIDVLIAGLNAQIDSFNENGYKLYDNENPSYFIAGLTYDKDDDKIYFICKEDK